MSDLEILRRAREDLIANGVELHLAEQVVVALADLGSGDRLAPALSAMCWLDARLGQRRSPLQGGAYQAFERLRQVFVRRVDACARPGLLRAIRPEWLAPVWR